MINIIYTVGIIYTIFIQLPKKDQVKVKKLVISLFSRTGNEVNEGGGGVCEGAGNELGSSPSSEVLGSSAPNTINTGMSFAKVKKLAIQN